MKATISGDAPTADASVRLRVDVYDALARAKGYSTVESQAGWHGVHRATLFNLRSGATVPRLDLAMRMAADLGVSVEVIFERVSA